MQLKRSEDKANGKPWNKILKSSKCKDEIDQQIEPKK